LAKSQKKKNEVPFFWARARVGGGGFLSPRGPQVGFFFKNGFCFFFERGRRGGTRTKTPHPLGPEGFFFYIIFFLKKIFITNLKKQKSSSPRFVFFFLIALKPGGGRGTFLLVPGALCCCFPWLSFGFLLSALSRTAAPFFYAFSPLMQILLPLLFAPVAPPTFSTPLIAGQRSPPPGNAFF